VLFRSRFSPKYWGKGYATESGIAAIKYGFETLQVPEITGTCHEENLASRRSLEKCGLTFVEKFIYNNALTCDWFRISREEWILRQKNEHI
jgi:RimJ/RimL family protein N-acetyltransferase